MELAPNVRPSRWNGGSAESLRSNMASMDWEYSRCRDRSTERSPIAIPKSMKMRRCLTSWQDSLLAKLVNLEGARGIPTVALIETGYHPVYPDGSPSLPNSLQIFDTLTGILARDYSPAPSFVSPISRALVVSVQRVRVPQNLIHNDHSGECHFGPGPPGAKRRFLSVRHRLPETLLPGSAAIVWLLVFLSTCWSTARAQLPAPHNSSGVLASLPARGLAAAIAEAGQIEVPAANPQELLNITATQASRWTEGSYEVWHLTGGVRAFIKVLRQSILTRLLSGSNSSLKARKQEKV